MGRHLSEAFVVVGLGVHDPLLGLACMQNNPKRSWESLGAKRQLGFGAAVSQSRCPFGQPAGNQARARPRRRAPAPPSHRTPGGRPPARLGRAHPIPNDPASGAPPWAWLPVGIGCCGTRRALWALSTSQRRARKGVHDQGAGVYAVRLAAAGRPTPQHPQPTPYSAKAHASVAGTTTPLVGLGHRGFRATP